VTFPLSQRCALTAWSLKLTVFQPGEKQAMGNYRVENLVEPLGGLEEEFKLLAT